jgi:hypothetical protein
MMPGPYGCYAAVYPLQFELVGGDLQNPQVVVESITKNKKIRPLVNVDGVEIGDELIAVDGKTFAQLVKGWTPFAGGANDFGAQRAVLSLLSWRSGSMYRLPDATLVTYRLKKQSGQVYEVSSPVVAMKNLMCLEMIDEKFSVKKRKAHDDAENGEDEEMAPVEQVKMEEEAAPSDSEEMSTSDGEMEIEKRKLFKRFLTKFEHPFL